MVANSAPGSESIERGIGELCCRGGTASESDGLGVRTHVQQQHYDRALSTQHLGSGSASNSS